MGEKNKKCTVINMREARSRQWEQRIYGQKKLRRETARDVQRQRIEKSVEVLNFGDRLTRARNRAESGCKLADIGNNAGF
jgi:hypothetical protein